MFSNLWGNKPYRSTEMALESDSGVTEPKEEEAIIKEEESITEDVAAPSTATTSSWWDYTASYTNMIKESAQKIDYSKISAKIGEKVNKESVENAKTNVGSYLNSMYNGLKTSVETIQKEGIPMISEFEQEQQKFVKMQHRRQGAAVPPWVGYNEEEKMMKQILSLSLDERNVLRDPPAGVDFIFELESNMPVATAMLEIDPKLNDLRFKLVPKVIKEDQFWKNYFYRVSLIKQSSQLATLQKTPAAPGPVSIPTPEEPDYSFSPQEDEFISDHLSNYEDAEDQELELNEEELKTFGLQKDSEKQASPDEEWEAELARELQEFDMVEDADGKLDTAGFEQELEQMLQNQ